jgi:adenylyltransferase/sulfurtransferase
MEEDTRDHSSTNGSAASAHATQNGVSRRLTDDEFDRYSRQMIVPGMGKDGKLNVVSTVRDTLWLTVTGQLRLINSRVLIIGAGGLGCPAAQYIAGAGVGTIGIIDGDVVETSNLHRQVGHATSRIGMKKVDSLITHLRGLNPLPTYIPCPTHLTPQNAADIISQYDLVMDCTDNPATRYLISDVCVLLCKPLVSAASVQKSGQLIVLNCPPTPQGLVDGKYAPCYRCCFRKPPPPSSMVSCGEAGIMGPVVGMMGVAQAGEAIKILASALHISRPPTEDTPERNLHQPTLLIYTYDLESAVGPYSFRALKMGGRKKNCFACGEGSTLTLDGIKAGNPNYEQFCSVPTSNVNLPPDERITAAEYHAAREKGELPEHVLIDTREKEHFSFGSIEGAVNVPFGKFLMKAAAIKRGGGEAGEILPAEVGKSNAPIFVVCRTGQDSQETVEKLKELGLDNGGTRKIVDIVGGMRAWKQEVDPSFPFI